MIRHLLRLYLPYGAIDLLILVAVISEVALGNFRLLWANLPLLLVGLLSFNRILRKVETDDSAD